MNMITKKDLIDVFGLSSKPALGPIFITEDGKFINLGENEEHGIIFNDDYDYSAEDYYFLEDEYNFIKANSGNKKEPYTYIDLWVRPNSHQQEAIITWLYLLVNSGRNSVLVFNSKFHLNYDLKTEIPEDIMKDILRNFTMNEDLDIMSVSYNGMTIEELHEVQGIDVFSKENIPALKAAGLIDDEGYPVDKYVTGNGEQKERRMSLSDLWELDSDFINTDYVMELAIKEIYDKANTPRGEKFRINYEARDLPSSRHWSDNFLKDCFSEDIFDYFYGYSDYSFKDCSYAIEDIPDEVLDLLESYGFPRDIYNQLMSENEDEDSPLAGLYNSLKQALVVAYDQANTDGSVNEALSAFNNAFEQSIPDGAYWIKEETTDEVRPIDISYDFVYNYLEDIWDQLGDYSDDLYSCLNEFLIQIIGDTLVDIFREPQYGWYGFDKESFKERLLDEIVDLHIENYVPDVQAATLQIGDDEEKNIESDSGEYKEDLDIQKSTIEEPKKLFYKYKEYNSELSKKAYKLDDVRLLALINFVESSPDKSYVDAFGLDILRDCQYYDCETSVILSKIKPSYVQAYNQQGYTIWVDEGSYSLKYIGYIPKQVGDNILFGLTEDLEFDVAGIPDIKIDDRLYFDGVENIIAGALAEDWWGVYIVNHNTKDVDYVLSSVDINTAFGEYNKLKDTHADGVLEVVLYVYDDTIGEDIPLQSFTLTDENSEVIHE